jgi:hypothetical protein
LANAAHWWITFQALEPVAGRNVDTELGPTDDIREVRTAALRDEEGSSLPLYDFVFPDGHRSEVRFRRPISPTAAVASRNKLYRIRRIKPVQETRSDRVRVELEKWPRRTPVLDRIYDLEHEG